MQSGSTGQNVYCCKAVLTIEGGNVKCPSGAGPFLSSDCSGVPEPPMKGSLIRNINDASASGANPTITSADAYPVPKAPPRPPPGSKSSPRYALPMSQMMTVLSACAVIIMALAV